MRPCRFASQSAAKPKKTPAHRLHKSGLRADVVCGVHTVLEQHLSSTELSIVIQVLLLAWKTGAKRMGFFTRTEFRRGAAKAPTTLHMD